MNADYGVISALKATAILINLLA